MVAVKSRILDYKEEDEHILRRLGTAVVVQWDSLPPAVQQLIRSQAVFMHDRYQTVQLNEQIGLFIDQHKGKD